MLKFLVDVTLSDELRWVLLSAISNEECRLTYGAQITDTMVCASGNYNEGPCLVSTNLGIMFLISVIYVQGDSGGPLIHVQDGGRVEIVAVASFVSANGCESSDPSGYTRTYPYVNWIRNVTDIWD